MSTSPTLSGTDELVADHVVVGGGSAGAVVAARLAERAGADVLLVEAGASGRHPLLLVPGAMALVKDWSRHAWLYQTEPDPSRAGRTDVWRRGRALGGSSSINGLIWARGLPRDFARWQQLGAKGWSWNDVLPHFVRAERAMGFDAPTRGHHGPIWVEKFRSPHPLSLALLRSFEVAGYPVVDDINAVTGEAVAVTQTNQRRGLRQSTETAYLRPALGRGGLRVLTRAQAQRLHFEGRRAVGVDIRRDDGSIQRVRARRELVVCAGAIETPALLMRSGVGAGEALKALGIQVVVDLPDVGRHMQDHPDLYVEYAVDQRTYSDAARFHRMVAIGLEFALRRRGAATSPGTHLFAYGRSRPGLNEPDLLIFTGPFGAIVDGAFTKRWPVYSATPSVCLPHSRGYVELRSADPHVPPRVQPNLLGDDRDLQLIVDAIGVVDRIVRQGPFAQHLRGRVSPGEDVPLHDRDALRGYARAATTTCHHSCGTCRMGNDARSVVDPQLRVRGVEGLRIADASVFPGITSGNLNAPVIMVAERAADLIARSRES
jgi:choline dehydrogenase